MLHGQAEMRMNIATICSKENNDVVCYCDAKTTKRGVANADSIPFFIRRSQWEFLQTLNEDIPYYIARVFWAITMLLSLLE